MQRRNRICDRFRCKSLYMLTFYIEKRNGIYCNKAQFYIALRATIARHLLLDISYNFICDNSHCKILYRLTNDLFPLGITRIRKNMQYLVMTRTQTYFFCQIVGQKKLLSPGTELNALILPKVRITQMLNVLASCWSVMARLWSNTVLQIYFKIHLSILKLKQGNLPIYKSKSSGTVKFTLIHLCSGKKLNLDSIKSHSSIHSTSRDGYMVGAEYGLGCTKYAAARNVSQSIVFSNFSVRVSNTYAVFSKD